MAAKGAPSLVATTRNPSGSDTTRSPWLIHTWWVSPGCHTPFEQCAAGLDAQRRPAELAMVGGFDGAAEPVDHGLLAIADAEHRHAEAEDERRRGRRALRRHRGRPAGQDNRLRAEFPDRGLADIERADFRVHTRFPDPPGDQLGVLRAEIEDQDAVCHNGVGGPRAVRTGPAYISRPLHGAMSELRSAQTASRSGQT